MIQFNLPKDQSSIIKVIGVGGGGSNAINHMYLQGIKGVDFVVCNTDQQALDISPVPNKVAIGASLTEGRGAGSIPEVGRNAAIENIEDMKNILANNTKMVFITAGLGGGTGTGAAPIIAAAAREMGILTVGIVTLPFTFEGKKRRMQADDGLEELRKQVDTILVISNDKLREMFGNLSLKEAFAQADNVLTTAAKGIAEIVTVTGLINVDFNDVYTVMRNGGAAIMGAAKAKGDNRAVKAAEQALNSPLLNDSNIKGASQVLLYITGGANEVTMDEVGEISDYIQDEAGDTANIIMGTGFDDSLGENLSVIIIATGFKSQNDAGIVHKKATEKIVRKLDDENKPAEKTVPKDPDYNPNQLRLDEPFMKKNDKEQVSVEFDLSSETVKRIPLHEELEMGEETKPKTTNKLKKAKVIDPQEQERKAQERINKLHELTLKLRTPSGIADLENKPAYIRRNINLDQNQHSSESNVSRYTLSEGEDKKIEIKPNNSFLHDNVD